MTCLIYDSSTIAPKGQFFAQIQFATRFHFERICKKRQSDCNDFGKRLLKARQITLQIGFGKSVLALRRRGYEDYGKRGQCAQNR